MKPTALSLALAGDIYLGRSYSEMDCQAFVERCLKDIGICLNLAGSNAWYRKMTWVGSPEECVKRFGSVPAGAFLFILADDGKEPAKYRGDGIGNASHIGIKTGRTQEQMLQAGLDWIADMNPDDTAERTAAQNAFRKKVGFGSGAVHSSSSRGCVATSAFADKTVKNGGWNRVGLWDRLDYGEKINRLLTGEADSPSAEQSPSDSVSSSTDVNERIEVSMTAKVYCESGETVKLRNTPSLKESLYWDIPDQTEVIVLEKGERWSRIQALGHSGYMLSSFLKFEEESVPVTVTLTMEQKTAQSLVQVLDSLVSQLESALGCG